MAYKKAYAAEVLALVLCLSLVCYPPVTASATSGQITTVADVEAKFTLSAVIAATLADVPASSDSYEGPAFNTLLFSIPGTHADEEYTVSFKCKDFICMPYSFGTSKTSNVSPLMLYCSTTSLGDDNYKSASYSKSFGSSHVFDVVAKEGSTPVYVYLTFPYDSYIYYSHPLIKKGSVWTGTIAVMGFTAYDITYEKQVGGDDLLSEAKKQTAIQEETKETTKGIFDRISDFFGGFFDNLGNTVLSWIVPSTEQLTGFLDEVNAWFGDRLGFVWYPFGLAVQLVQSLAGGTADSTVRIPALSLNLLGDSYQIWDSMEIDIDAFGIFQYVRYFTDVILVAGVAKLAYDKWDEWIGGHGVG